MQCLSWNIFEKHLFCWASDEGEDSEDEKGEKASPSSHRVHFNSAPPYFYSRPDFSKGSQRNKIVSSLPASSWRSPQLWVVKQTEMREQRLTGRPSSHVTNSWQRLSIIPTTSVVVAHQKLVPVSRLLDLYSQPDKKSKICKKSRDAVAPKSSLAM